MTLELLKGGANNRVFRLEQPDKDVVVVKHYFAHPQDTRHRLQSEFSFLSYAWEKGIRCIPKPISFDAEKNTGTYSYIPGTPATAQDITPDTIAQAMDFFLALNRDKAGAESILSASEACFSLHDYQASVERRLHSLQAVSQPEVQEFIQKTLLPTWETLSKFASKAQAPLRQEERCITPSDFGFHNVLMSEGKAYFIDFEYGGWDDPAKTACDFFCQPKIPVPFEYFERVTEAISRAAANPEACLKRIQTVLPVCRFKWCCLMLNSFLKVGKDRRNFAHSQEDAAIQLLKVKSYFKESLCI